MLKPIFEDLPSKKDCGRPLLLGDTICLAQYKQYVLDLFGNGLDELQFVSRDGRIGSDHSDSGIDMRQKRVRGGTIAFNTEPRPGVSTKHMPFKSNGLGTNTSTPATPFLFCGFFSSVTYCSISCTAISAHSPRCKRRRAP